MILDFDIPREESTIEKQRMVARLVTSQSFINAAAQKVEMELNTTKTLPYVYTHNLDDNNMDEIRKDNLENNIGLKRSRSIFKKIR